MKLLDCGHEPSPHSAATTGYGKNAEGKTFCYDCAAELDREQLRTGRATLYLSKDAKGLHQVTNWPGSLKIECGLWKFEQCGGGFGAQRTDCWFYFEGRKFHGVNRGDNDILRVRQVQN